MLELYPANIGRNRGFESYHSSEESDMKVSGDGVAELGEEIVGDGGGGADEAVGYAGVDHLSAGHGPRRRRAEGLCPLRAGRRRLYRHSGLSRSTA